MSVLSNVVFQATQGAAPFKYLGVITNDGPDKDYIGYAEDAVLSKNAKFKVENASGGLVHILSCSNNKYLMRSSTAGNWIVAQGIKAENDKTSWTCTLFRMDIDDNKRVTLYHVQSGRVVRIPNDASARKMFWTISPTGTIAVSLAIDHDTFVVLPKIVAFRGSNGLFYMNYPSTPRHEGYGQFTVKDIGDPRIVCETLYTKDGRLCLKVVDNNPSGQLWIEMSDLITISASGTSPTDPKCMFVPIRISDNVVALRSVGNNKICQRAYTGLSVIREERLIASANGTVADTHLEVFEPLIRRTVYSVEFDLNKARIYGITLLYTDEHVWNNPTDQPQKGTADGKITSTKSKTYTNTISVSGSVTTTFETGVPFIAEGRISVSATASYTHEWASTETEEQSVGHVFEVVVLPRKKTIARGTATRASCDVPFAYVQKDYPAAGGPPIITRLYDGVFKGANAYGFVSEVRYEDLTPKELSAANQNQVKFFTVAAKKPTADVVTLTPTAK